MCHESARASLPNTQYNTLPGVFGYEVRTSYSFQDVIFSFQICSFQMQLVPLRRGHPAALGLFVASPPVAEGRSAAERANSARGVAVQVESI